MISNSKEERISSETSSSQTRRCVRGRQTVHRDRDWIVLVRIRSSRRRDDPIDDIIRQDVVKVDHGVVDTLVRSNKKYSAR